MKQEGLKIFARGGDALTAPANTETAFMAALGSGATGLVCPVQLTRDGVLVCADNPSLGEMDWSAVKKLDAGADFCSISLDSNNRATENKGKDKPWSARTGGAALRYPTLERMLVVFGRYCPIIMDIDQYEETIVNAVIELLKRYGLERRVRILGDYKTCEFLEYLHPAIQKILRIDSKDRPDSQIWEARRVHFTDIYIDWEIYEGLPITPDFVVWFGSQEAYAPSPEIFAKILDAEQVGGIVARGVLPTVSLVTPESLVLKDDFVGKQIDTIRWAAGYSHQNSETQISQEDGLHITIAEGSKYSGAAAVCLLPLYGRFDAQVDFHVENPTQGTTFEMAAICIDPGYHHPANGDLNSKNVNLTFDVHGAPPYASSERDEDDGFRCGWNNGFCLTQINQEWEASSANMYNKYGRDVGCGNSDNSTGSLRLIRNGDIFVSYYRDKYNDEWVCSGAMLVQNMAQFAYIRLAAKHWHKVKGKPVPANHIQFTHFKLYQF